MANTIIQSQIYTHIYRGLSSLPLYFFQVSIEWEKIEAKIELEYQKERERPSGGSVTSKGKGR